MGENKKLTNLVKNDFGSNWRDDRYGKHAHIIFIDAKPIQVISSYISWPSKPEIVKPNFKDFLGGIDHTDFNKLLLLVTTYPEYYKICKPANKSLKIRNEHLNRFLKETNGWLVYNHQTVALYRMATGANDEQATIFRKNINKKLEDTLKESKKINIFGTTFHGIIDNRMKIGFTYNPNYQGTYKLFQYLNK